ncbi:MAG: YvrJ family protein [Planctomycetes bacterium]|nr:YvrJ family protein [Planctomycetota bacterium]
MNEFITIIEQVGFPIFLTLYLVVRQDKLLVSILMELRKINGTTDKHR